MALSPSCGAIRTDGSHEAQRSLGDGHLLGHDGIQKLIVAQLHDEIRWATWRARRRLGSTEQKEGEQSQQPTKRERKKQKQKHSLSLDGSYLTAL